MAVRSTYNVIVPLSHTGESAMSQYAIFNLMSGTLDVIDEQVASTLKSMDVATAPGTLPVSNLTKRSKGHALAQVKSSAEPRLPTAVLNYLDQRGYLFDSGEDEHLRSRILHEELLTFHRKIARQPLVIIPSYNCDLKCPYCWQRLYHLDSEVMSEEMVEHFFKVLPTFMDDPTNPERIDFTIFGGEPLQDVSPLKERVIGIVDRAKDAGYSVGVISNGVGLAAYAKAFKGKVGVCQITIDGPEHIHKARRPLPHNGDSFTPMVEGINRALDAGIQINVRVNTDESNLYTLPELVDFAKTQGWLTNDKLSFHLAPVKNHNPRKESNSESELLMKVLDFVAKDERMKAFDLSGFSGMKYFDGFKRSGLFSLHRFFNCEAQINFFSFDLHGDVYTCWDASGQKNLAVGRFTPEPVLFSAKMAQWRTRSSLDVSTCGGCTASPHCGGGCQFLALEHNDTFLASQCESVTAGYVHSITANSEWILERATAGDHSVGLVTGERVVQAVTKPFGLADMANNTLRTIGCG